MLVANAEVVIGLMLLPKVSVAPVGVIWSTFWKNALEYAALPPGLDPFQVTVNVLSLAAAIPASSRIYAPAYAQPPATLELKSTTFVIACPPYVTVLRLTALVDSACAMNIKARSPP